MTLPLPCFTHLVDMSDAGGLFEHAELTCPRPEHGYCVDDAARGLVVLWREPSLAPELLALAASYLDFVLAAQDAQGRFLNRRSVDLTWSGEATVEDCWGRALWGLGAVVTSQAPTTDRDSALAGFEAGARHRSPWSRAMTFAALGAAAVLTAYPDHRGARDLLDDTARAVGRPRADPAWPWPEDRLTYANAAVPEVLIAAGAASGDARLVDDGLGLLQWLLARQTREGHLSVVPVGGSGRTDTGPGFDQQPIEVAALADACARAFAVTGQQRWRDAVALCNDWFLGDNDSRTSLHGLAGGGCDGLERHGRNENQGAESTLALLGTLQQGHLLADRHR